MTEIIDDKALEPVESETTPECNFATVGEVYDDGLTLIFDGQEEASATSAIHPSASRLVTVCGY